MARRTTRFEDLTVWQKSRALAGDVYKATNQGPFARDFGLRDQLRRAAVSVMSNIAEGFGRYTRPEFRRFVIIARGSIAEAQSQLYLARDLGYLTEAEHQELNTRCLDISRMLAALRTSLEPSRT
jgi:four helix bundle protein